ncbi:hypothetical protein Tco_0987328, partial [Tanacetum coccineum]
PPLLSATTITAGPPAAVLSVEGLLQLQYGIVNMRLVSMRLNLDINVVNMIMRMC